MTEAAIRVDNLGKRYQLHGGRTPQQYGALRDVLADAVSASVRRLLPRRAGARQPGLVPTRRGEFWALKEVGFEVKCGEVVGIIGRNGAGKSTLLKILAGITEPTCGEAAVRGRLASLLEVGTGFHPELSGRENIFLNGAILGMAQAEIRRKLDEIVSFAEVDAFLDTPVKHYSSGMYLRLAFSVAAHLEPEILLVDEVLAVGDAAFQKKCLGKMDEVARTGRTVLFVSHNLAAVQQLTRTSLFLDRGRLVAQGPSPDVIRLYLDSVMNRDYSTYDVEDTPRRYPELERQVEFLRVELADQPNGLLPADADLQLLLTLRGHARVDGFRVSITIFQADGTPVGNAFGPDALCIDEGERAVFRMTLSDLRLARGGYYCALALGKGSHLTDRTEFDIILDVVHFQVLGPVRADGVMSEWFSVWGPICFTEPTIRKVNSPVEPELSRPSDERSQARQWRG
jgi:lipopolysaccharide transport system ATP-binding protein